MIPDAAVGLVQLILDDLLKVLADENCSLDARQMAWVIGNNIVRWDAGMGLVALTQADRTLLRDPIRLTPSPML